MSQEQIEIPSCPAGNADRQKPRPRKASTAVALSLVLPGVGHVYCGRLVQGLALACVAGLAIPLVAAMVLVRRVGITSGGFLAAMGAVAGFCLVVTVHAWLLARRAGPDYRLKEYNRRSVYLLLMLMGTGGSVGLALQIRATLVQAFVVPAASMYPTIVPGDRLLCNKVAYDEADPARGDIILFPNPDDRRQTFIKRVVALAGETVEIRAGVLHVNGQPAGREPVPTGATPQVTAPNAGEMFYETNGSVRYMIFAAAAPATGPAAEFGPVTVPKGHCFVLGDNRSQSRDSRKFGPVPLAAVKGRADYLYFPAEDWSRAGGLRP